MKGADAPLGKRLRQPGYAVNRDVRVTRPFKVHSLTSLAIA